MADPEKPPVRYIPVAEFRERGYLQELNRLFLHPLGMALEIRVDPAGPGSLVGIWDYRDDPEGITYHDTPSGNLARQVAAERAAKDDTRMALLGYTVQPPGPLKY